MALEYYLVLALCVVLYTNADRAFNETSTVRVPNDNMSDNNQGIYVFITTFFDLLWYIVGLIVFCVCSISCLLLFYIQQRRKHDPKPLRPISESTRTTQSIDPSNGSNDTVIRKTTLSTQSTVLSVTSMTKSPTKSPQFPTSAPTATHSKNTYSLSAFSNVDSEGIDLDDTINAFSEYNVFNTLAPISERMHSSPSTSNHSSCDSDNGKPRSKRKLNDEREETLDDETEDDMLSMQRTGDNSMNRRDDSIDSSDSSADSANPMTIIGMMKKRAHKSSPRCLQNQARGTKYKRRYARTIDSETEFDPDFV